ncbi:MAG TPA: hypothetical protein PK075_01115 [Chitinophagales bacterium]|nr:hypothetical protein [Chitinophagales bacterium]
MIGENSNPVHPAVYVSNLLFCITFDSSSTPTFHFCVVNKGVACDFVFVGGLITKFFNCSWEAHQYVILVISINIY